MSSDRKEGKSHRSLSSKHCRSEFSGSSKIHAQYCVTNFQINADSLFDKSDFNEILICIPITFFCWSGVKRFAVRIAGHPISNIYENWIGAAKSVHWKKMSGTHTEICFRICLLPVYI